MKLIIQNEKKNCGTGLVPAKSTGTGPSPNSTGTGPEPEFRSGHSLHLSNLVGVKSLSKVLN